VEPITGVAAGVPFTALPPKDGSTRLVVTWHMLDAPRTNAAFAAALPMAEVPAWRVHLGMPFSGARMINGSLEQTRDHVLRDPVLTFFAAFVRQAAKEFPPALAQLRSQLPVDDQPVGIVGASLGGAVALRVLAGWDVPIAAAAVVNSAIRVRTVVGMIEEFTGPYPWTDESNAAVGQLDFIARAEEVAAGGAPVLIVSGEEDEPVLRTEAAELADGLRQRYANPGQVQLTTIPGLPHALADEPGLEPAPQGAGAKAVDDELSAWFIRHLGAS
jgi:pimeloyl-ACP methyl ester carboxylesterase